MWTDLFVRFGLKTHVFVFRFQSEHTSFFFNQIFCIFYLCEIINLVRALEGKCHFTPTGTVRSVFHLVKLKDFQVSQMISVKRKNVGNSWSIRLSHNFSNMIKWNLIDLLPRSSCFHVLVERRGLKTQESRFWWRCKWRCRSRNLLYAELWILSGATSHPASNKSVRRNIKNMKHKTSSDVTWTETEEEITSTESNSNETRN